MKHQAQRKPPSGVIFTSRKARISTTSEKNVAAPQESDEADNSRDLFAAAAAASASNLNTSNDDNIGRFGSTANTKLLDRSLAWALHCFLGLQ